MADTPPIRPDVLAMARRAAMLTYVHSRDKMRLDDMATSLDAGVTPRLLERWRKEDRWEEARADAVGHEAMALSDAELRRADARMSVERMHDRAWAAQRTLRPKTWETALSLQMRAAETLRVWADEDVRRLKAQDTQAEIKPAATIPEEAVEELSEEAWQQAAHVLLSTRHSKEPKTQT